MVLRACIWHTHMRLLARARQASVTVNVALTADAASGGGRLLGVYGRAVREIARGEGDATVHSSALLHGVTRMTHGTRYSMIMFFSSGCSG